LNTGSTPETGAIKVSGLLRSLTIGQAWALGSAVVALVVGSAAVGAYVQGGRDDAAQAVLSRSVSDSNTKASGLSALLNEQASKVADGQRAVDALKGSLKTSEDIRRGQVGEIEFLNLDLAYTSEPDDETKRPLVDYICEVWKRIEARRANGLDGAAEMNGIPEVASGELDPEIRALLKRQGVSEDILDHIEDPNRTRGLNAQVGALIQKQLSMHRMTKTVRFPDGLIFRWPTISALYLSEPKPRSHFGIARCQTDGRHI
jgi:hypothetical protein